LKSCVSQTILPVIQKPDELEIATPKDQTKNLAPAVYLYQYRTTTVNIRHVASTVPSGFAPIFDLPA
jgi:hypothetical protein